MKLKSEIKALIAIFIGTVLAVLIHDPLIGYLIGLGVGVIVGVISERGDE